MTVLSVPFHLDEQITGFVPPVPPDEVIAPALPAGGPWERMAVLYAEVADAVDLDGVSVVLSGDCTTVLAVMAGVQRAGVDPALVWFDAHGDLQTPETSTSGYLGGFPVRQLVGGSDRSVPRQSGVPVDAVVEALPEGPVHLHVDADVVDPGDLPGLRFPASAGPRLPQVLSAVRAVLSTVPVVAVTVACTWRGAGTPQFAALVREIAESAR